MIRLQPGDVVLTAGPSWISRAIRVFQRDKGELPSKVNHVGIVVESPDIIVEALWTVKRHSIQRYTEPGNQVAVYRMPGLTDDERRRVVEVAETYAGRKYGVGKIALHAADRALANALGIQDAYAFRRLALIDRYPICSYVVAKAYAAIRYLFLRWVDPKRCQPDHIWDDVTDGPPWVCVLPLQKLEPGVIESSLVVEERKRIA